MRHTARSLSCTLTVICVLLALRVPAYSQTSLAEIVGEVRDTTGNPMQRVTVVLTNEATSVSTSLITNDVGAFASTSMLPGIYRIEATSPGFKTYAASHVELRTGQILRQDITL